MEIRNEEKLKNPEYAIFANIIKPHRFLRMNALCEIHFFSGAMDAAFIDSAISKSGRRLKEFWIPIKYLDNFRVKYSYRKVKTRKDYEEKQLMISINLPGLVGDIYFPGKTLDLWKEQ